jgi:hypothetical protein
MKEIHLAFSTPLLETGTHDLLEVGEARTILVDVLRLKLVRAALRHSSCVSICTVVLAKQVN